MKDFGNYYSSKNLFHRILVQEGNRKADRKKINKINIILLYIEYRGQFHSNLLLHLSNIKVFIMAISTTW